MLETLHLTKRYPPPPTLLRPFLTTAARGTVEALRDVSLSVPAGTVAGLVGPNGAGKTTLIKVIGGLLEPSEGSVRVGAVDVVRDPRTVKGQLGLVLADDRGLYRRLTGRQNLEFFGVMAGLTRAAARSRARTLLAEFDLDDRDKRVFGYSSGMKARLAIARALVADPPLVVLDEPSRSLDPVASAELGEMLRHLAGQGRAVLLSSHRIDEVVRYCDTVAILVGGTVRFAGPPASAAPDGRGGAPELVALLEREIAADSGTGHR